MTDERDVERLAELVSDSGRDIIDEYTDAVARYTRNAKDVEAVHLCLDLQDKLRAALAQSERKDDE